MFKLVSIAACALVLGQTSDKILKDLSPLVAVVQSKGKASCMGYFRDKISFVAPASCLASSEGLKYYRQSTRLTRGEVAVGSIFVDSRWKKEDSMDFNTAIAFIDKSRGPKRGPETKTKVDYISGADGDLNGVGINNNDLQLIPLTLDDGEVCKEEMKKQKKVRNEDSLDNFFCAYEKKADASKMIAGSPVFASSKDGKNNPYVGGIKVGDFERDGNQYYIFIKVTDAI